MRMTALAVAICSASVNAGVARAELFTIDREITYTISPGGPDFAGASVAVSNVETIGAGSAGSTNYGGPIGFSPARASLNFTQTGGVSVTAAPPTATGDVPLTISATGAGSWSFSDTVPVITFRSRSVFSASVPLALENPINRYPIAATDATRYAPAIGRNVLEFAPQSSELVDDGGRFGVHVVIAGNWSAFQLDHGYLLAIVQPAWTITNDLAYDPLTDTTRFDAVNADFQASEGGPFPVIYLIGTPVPEPSSLAILGAAAILGVAAARRQHLGGSR